MTIRQRIANWISGGELAFHQQAAVEALAEAQMAQEAAMLEHQARDLMLALLKCQMRLKEVEQLVLTAQTLSEACDAIMASPYRPLRFDEYGHHGENNPPIAAQEE